jgi:intracellular multiplication protein IcmJ
MLKLLLGVIRDTKLFRSNSVVRERADAEYKARRPGAMARGRYRCVFCGYTSQKFNECHHIDGDHANNTNENFAVVDTLCHAYQHVGQRASQDRFASDNLRDRTLIAAVPEISATDLNLLQRALGVALSDEKEAPTAQLLLKRLANRAKPVKEAFGTFETGDFSAGMATLDDESYKHRGSVMGDLRLLFHAEVLKHEGDRFMKEFPALPVDTWGGVADDATRTSAAQQQ